PKIKEAFPVKKILTLGVIGFLLIFPVFLMMFGETGQARFAGVGIFSDTGPLVQVNELRGEHQSQTSIAAKIFHNKPVAYLTNFFGHYFEHYTADFLFINGDVIERNKVPLMGQMYLIELPLLLAGIYFLIRRADSSSAMVFWWLAVAPLAASMTYQTPHALRALNMVIPLTFLTGFGLCGVIAGIKKILFKKLTIGFLIFLFLLSFTYYAHLYYVHLPMRYPLSSEYGFSETINYVGSIDKDAEKIIVTDYYDQPYILWLFYLKYPPKDYQPQAKLTPRDKFGFGTVRSFDKYEFRSIDWEKDKNLSGVIIVAAPSEIKTKISPLEIVSEKTIYFPNGEAAFRVIKK
ncbi:MAG: hypothetical protein Q8N98_03390, partial [bacterium]|nr:hypothetical protein [bacterium]